MRHIAGSITRAALGKTQSLCRDCHEAKTDVETGRQVRRRIFPKQAFDINGWPISDEEWRERDQDRRRMPHRPPIAA